MILNRYNRQVFIGKFKPPTPQNGGLKAFKGYRTSPPNGGFRGLIGMGIILGKLKMKRNFSVTKRENPD